MCLSAMAVLPSKGFISLKRVIVPFYPGTGHLPKTEPMELFSAFQNPDEIVISSEVVSGLVTVSIYDSMGTIVATTSETIVAGGDISIDISALPTGLYILEIEINDTILVGEFEI